MRRGAALVLASWVAASSGCAPSGAPSVTRPAPPADPYTLSELIGEWRWMLRTAEAGTTRIEAETWQFRPGATPVQLVGRYVRSIEVRSDDRVPFRCNQRLWYRQRALIDVVVEHGPTGFVVRETEYQTEPGPCERGFRPLGAYTAELDGGQLRLSWDGGTQTLLRTDDQLRALPDEPWSATPPLHGAWRWDATSYDDEGNLQDETEWWEITRRTETQLDVTYRRRVTVRSTDGTNLACANAPSWSFDDAYVLDGQREDEHWHLYERAVIPAHHPCLRVTPQRALDEATAEQRGEHLILEWRGKRRQILFRPE